MVGFATGFVIKDPRGNKRILTAAHSFASRAPAKHIVSATYWAPGQNQFLPCDKVWEDTEHDLAVLNPHSSFPLPQALTIARKLPSANTKVFAIGSPAGLLATPFEGDIEPHRHHREGHGEAAGPRGQRVRPAIRRPLLPAAQHQHRAGV